MEDEELGEAVTLSIECSVATTARDEPGWAAWEQQRTRSFLSATEAPLDDQGKLGRYRNTALALVMKREGEGFAGSWTYTIETKIGPNRVQRDGRVVVQLKNGSTVLVSAPAPGVATACGDWRSQSWSGTLTLEQFDAINSAGITGDVNVRRC